MRTPYARRLSDDIPLGVECALPRIPDPAPAEPARPRAKIDIWRKLVLALVALLLIAGLWQLGQGVYIHVKAALAQVLVGRAWERTLAGEREVKPWPSADAWPVARLTLPEKNIDVFILEGAGGRAVAFGPGHLFGTALPGEEGNSVIGGHRDTHLAFLRDVAPGSEIVVQRQNGSRRVYRIQAARVLDEKESWVMKQDGWTRMTLITGYPFDARRAGGPLRYVVFADAIAKRG